jgi:polygalacturonase
MLKISTITRIIFMCFFLSVLPVITFCEPVSYNIQDYGAKGDGTTLNTRSIQSAIDACALSGGGTVYFPSGNYLSGTLILRSHITLHLEPGAVLAGSKNLQDYPVTISKIRSFTDSYTDKSLIYGEGLENIAIIGQGTLDGNGASFTGEYKRRPYMIRLINCKNVQLKDVFIMNSPMWVQHFLGCTNVNIDGITVHSRVNENNDGIDIDGCNNVRISNCEIISGDDGIVLKSTFGQSCKNVVITNCVISSDCNAFKLGTETNSGFQNITLNNCTIYDTHLAGIALEIVDGGSMNRVSVSNVTMNDVGTAIFIRLGNRARPFKEGMEKPETGSLSDIIISNIQATNVGITGCSVTGLPGYPIKNITLENIHLRFNGGGTQDLVSRDIQELPEGYPEYSMFGKLPAYGFYCRHAENLTLNNVDLDFIKPDVRSAIVCDDIIGLQLFRITARITGNEPLIRCKEVKNMLVQSCIAPPGVGTFLQIDGSGSGHITLLGNDLSGAKNAVTKEKQIEVFLDSNRLK